MRHFTFFLVILSLFSAKAFAKSQNEFFLQSSLSLEYSAPSINGGGSNVDFKTNNFGKQFTGIENFAIGGNLRIHKYVGFNANWSQSALHNNYLQDIGVVSQEARFKINHYNISALTYLPINKIFELFIETGISDMNSRLHYVTASGSNVSRKAHETTIIYGGGFQVKVSDNCDDAWRFSFQKYSGKLALLNANYTTVRIGYLRFF